MNRDPSPGVSGPLRCGMREAFGVPAAVLGAGFIGYGALAAENGYPVWLVIFATVTVWALPGQLVLIELKAVGASAFAIIAASALTGARFLPMTMALVPVMRDRRYPRLAYYLAAHLVSMTGWAAAMRRCPELPPTQRLPYFVGFAVTCLVTCATCAAAGHYLAGVLPHPVRLGFAFLTPLYFFVVLIGDARTLLAVASLAFGAALGPLIHLASPAWSVMAAGLIGGSAAYLVQRRYGRRVR